MKKFLAFLLAMMVAMSMCTFAFAEEGNDDTSTTPDGSNDQSGLTDEQFFDIAKVYYLLNEGTNSPAATFEFKIEKLSVSDSEVYDKSNMPVPTYKLSNPDADDNANFPIVFGDEDQIDIDGYKKVVSFTLPTYEAPGIFTYKISEVTPTTAGVKLYAYDNDGNLVEAGTDEGYLRMIVTAAYNEKNDICRVVNVYYENEDGQKINVPTDATSGIVNVYCAGSLKITKNVTGNMGDTSKLFKIDVTFEGQNVDSVIEYEIKNGDHSAVTNGKGTINPSEWENGVVAKEIELSHNQYIVFSNIPYGVEYSVKEQDYVTDDKYDTPKYELNNVKTAALKSSDPANGETPVSGALMDSPSEMVKITNNKGMQINTGLVLDTLPYVILLAVAVAGVVMMLLKKRASRED